MPLILNIETATNVCSVALSKNGKLLSIRESSEPKAHSGSITLYIEEVMQSSGYNLQEIDAIAVSKGPGSFTGLRIGISAAKGLCYALDIPLIAVNTLESAVYGYIRTAMQQNALLCPMIDARRMEVYTAIYDETNKEIFPPSAEIIYETSFADTLKRNKVVFFGDCILKIKPKLSHQANAIFEESFLQSAKNMIVLSTRYYKEDRFEDIAYFEPFYLKDFVKTIHA